jgi:hypothetical protein
MEIWTSSLRERAETKGFDPDAVCERAAIMEIDGGLPRWMAEQYALKDWQPSVQELGAYLESLEKGKGE